MTLGWDKRESIFVRKKLFCKSEKWPWIGAEIVDIYTLNITKGNVLLDRVRTEHTLRIGKIVIIKTLYTIIKQLRFVRVDGIQQYTQYTVHYRFHSRIGNRECHKRLKFQHLLTPESSLHVEEDPPRH